jgi:folate-binding protein YgfZ
MAETWAYLPNRAVLNVSGTQARGFLQGLLTCDLAELSEGGAQYGALLSPQGKVLFDAIVIAHHDGFFLDTAREQLEEFAKRLGMYRLRAAITIVSLPQHVIAVWGGDVPPQVHAGSIVFRDPRHPALGWRILTDTAPLSCLGDYCAHRIEACVPEGGIDFLWGENFAHDINLDLLHGVSFDKGCYLGQEVVSRVHHRSGPR